jgi:hypothetical protein
VKNIEKKTLTEEENQQFHYNSWCYLFRTARFLDIDGNDPEQQPCWFGMFGGKYKKTKASGQKAAELIFNDPYFMYWRLGMGAQKPSKEGVPAMAVGTSLKDVNDLIDTLVKEGPNKHPHRRAGQGGGMTIAGDSGMGPATTYLHGDAHIKLQTGQYGTTLAKTFYDNPLVVFERFRVKTHASWGAGHVDHDVRSRPKEINELYTDITPPVL